MQLIALWLVVESKLALVYPGLKAYWWRDVGGLFTEMPITILCNLILYAWARFLQLRQTHLQQPVLQSVCQHLLSLAHIDPVDAVLQLCQIHWAWFSFWFLIWALTIITSQTVLCFNIYYQQHNF